MEIYCDVIIGVSVCIGDERDTDPSYTIKHSTCPTQPHIDRAWYKYHAITYSGTHMAIRHMVHIILCTMHTYYHGIYMKKIVSIFTSRNDRYAFETKANDQ